MADVSVRPARADDAPEIARIQLETWRLAYAKIVPAAVLDGLDLDAAAEAWTGAITTPPSKRHHVLVANEQQWTVGFTALGDPGPDDLQPEDPDAGTTAVLGPLLVEPRWGRRGHGSRLLAAAVDHARGDGMTRAITWVPEQDDVSQAFLTSAGWAADGFVRVLDTGAGELREARLLTILESE